MYDPLTSSNPQGLPLANSYWASTVDITPARPSLNGRRQTDIAVIGAGFTGLLTARYLAEEYGREVTVVEANRVGFGASARNGGFVLKGSGRLGFAQMARRWDLDTARGIYGEFSEAVARVKGMIESDKIACEPQQPGYLKIAHSPKAMKSLQSGAEFITGQMGMQAEFIEPERFRREYLNHRQSFGALRLEDGFGLNPLKLLQGYAQRAQELGVTIFEDSTVLGTQRTDKGFTLETAGGQLEANAVVYAGNAYTQPTLTAMLSGRALPILSNVIVTAPLTPEQLQMVGLHTTQVAMDTRVLKYYYRLLPDNRLLFGGRGAVWGKHADKEVYVTRLKQAMVRAFPPLAQVDISHHWHGWLAASLDDIPHIYTRDGEGYSLGYCGAGVSFSAQAAWRLAGMLNGVKPPDLPLYGQPLPSFPFARFRRFGQWGFYHFGRFMDALG
ncbi:FAD-binding oxidoreductase [Shewanella corallii]|uniref:FAD-binding oxidoreductase n=1 Tax=Shewanella corallii TaxID=560080 RepID=A0ABT0N1K1_9GAMM|nr:FAD-dependent oxidoreductase [Shewanella corallii]MCL2912327.1 FAD-binding oxidoreductase [Shewanella corallii]